MALARQGNAEPRAPTDERTMNSFAHTYNDYVERLRAGVVDLKRWKHVTEAWRRMTGQAATI